MMHTRWKNWIHVTKLDPDKMLPAGAIAEIASSGTDALMLSGTLNVTAENMAALAKEAKDPGSRLSWNPQARRQSSGTGWTWSLSPQC